MDKQKFPMSMKYSQEIIYKKSGMAFTFDPKNTNSVSQLPFQQSPS